MELTLEVWRQKSAGDAGRFETYKARNISHHMSFLEMLDVVNQDLIEQGKEPIAFDHDCREGVCGMCGFVIDGHAHGPLPETTICQLHMRTFKDGDTIVIEPFRARAFPIRKDLIVDRSALDRIIAAGGYISVSTGSAQDANATPVAKDASDRAFDAAACIGCGACVASCPNASAMLFTSAKISHLGLLPQGQVERQTRVEAMVAQMDAESFGACTNHAECEAHCPKGIDLSFIARMNRDFISSKIKRQNPRSAVGD